MHSMGEVHDAGTPPWGFFSSGQVGHRFHRGMWLLSAAAYSAAPVLRTAATTEVAKDPSDGGDGVQPSSSNAGGISFCNIINNNEFILDPEAAPL